MEWISVEDRLPRGQCKVIAFYRNRADKKRTVMAQYIPPLTVHCCDFYDFDAEFDADYIDGHDEGFVKEGWHEVIDNWLDCSGCEIVEGVVTYWQPIPAPPKEEKG